MHFAVITLHGTVKDPEILVYGAKVIGVRQGDLDLHGRPRNVTWTRLQATAMANDTFLLLEVCLHSNESINQLIFISYLLNINCVSTSINHRK